MHIAGFFCCKYDLFTVHKTRGVNFEERETLLLLPSAECMKQQSAAVFCLCISFDSSLIRSRDLPRVFTSEGFLQLL
ncbi:unnamed protein product [Coffea canephora]|uniref:Uncharacterized protein n=1 Tax=Coffea canephora TaxID=49390 RepID=A0A068TPH3_COFCA|nr:unnamed protein product [Coffea canephora]